MRALHNPRFTVRFRGGWITLDPRDWIQNEILTRGEFDEDVWKALQSHAVGDETLWDIGAHVGTVTVRALNDSRFRRVHAFEPHPATFAQLDTNIRINTGNGRAHNLALGDTCGETELFEGLEANTGLASMVPRWGTKSISVPCMTIDAVIDQNRAPIPTLIKIDTEGAEKAVLVGAHELLAKHPPKAIVFESEFTGGNIRDRELEQLLETAGYSVTPLSSISGADGCTNWIAVRK